MHELSRVFLEMDARNADIPDRAAGLNGNSAMFAQEKIILGNLVTFGQVWIKIMFAVEFGELTN